MNLSDYIASLYIDEPITADELKYSEQQLKIAALNHALVLRRYRINGMVEEPDSELLVGEEDERIKRAQERKRQSTERNATEQENQNRLIQNIRKQLRRKRELERDRNK